MTTLDLFERVGKVRDGLLVGASVVYILGYLTWSIYAWRLGLGAVDVIDAQYFAAGIPVAAVLAMSLTGASLLRSVAEGPWRRFMVARSNVFRRIVDGILRIVVVAAAVGALIVLVSLVRNAILFRIIYLTSLVLLLSLLVVSYSLMHLRSPVADSTTAVFRYDRFLRLVVTPTVYAIAGVALIGLIILRVYPTMPSPFGGKPRSAQLDLRADAVSPQTLCALTGAPVAVRTGVVRTKAIWILTSRTEMVVLLEEPTVARTPPITLRNDSVTAVIWR